MGQEGIVLDIIDYLDENLNDEISIENIAGKFHFNRYYLMKLFKKITGITILEYANHQKIKSSLDDIAKTDDKILKIALKNGFNSLEYYSETFYKVIGTSPTQFRKVVSVKPEILLEGDEAGMTRLEKVQNDIQQLNELRQSLLGNAINSGEKRTKSLVVRKDKPKVYELKKRKPNSEHNKAA